ncbi:MAG: sulfatase/phosphatase domain-containing protein, partial [Maribacter sp.]
EGGIKVPFFMVWQNKIQASSTYDQVVSSLDLYPTLLSAAGGSIEQETQLDGVDLIPFIENKMTGKPHETLYWRSVGGFEYAIRYQNYKLYKSAYKDKTMLFNLKTDAYERHDVAEIHPEIISKLEALYTEWDSKNIPPGWVDPHPENVIKEEKNFKGIREKSLRPKS